MADGLNLVKKALSPGYYSGKAGGAFAAFDIANIAAADNKFKALTGTVKNLVAFNLFGWTGLIVGGLLGMGSAIKGLVRDSGTLTAAMQRLGQLRLYEAQFAPFVKGAGAARERVAELIREIGKPWGLDKLVEGSRNLEVLTRGGFSSSSALKMVSDSAVHAGQDLGSTAAGVGGLYAELRDGVPIGATASQLEQMGIISAQTARRVAELQAEGAPLLTTFGMVQADMARAAGSSAMAGDSFDALRTKYEETQSVLAKNFGENFLEGEKEGLKNTIATMENLAPAAARVGAALGSVITFGENFLTTVVRMATAIPGLAAGAEYLTRALIVLTGVLTVTSIQRWYNVLATTIPAVYSFATATLGGTNALGAWIATQRASVAAMVTGLTVSETATVAKGAEAAASLTSAAASGAETVAKGEVAVATAAATVASEEHAAAEIAEGTAAMATPWGLIAVAIGLLAAGIWQAVESEKAHEKAISDLNAAGSETISKLGEQISAMRNLDDQQQALIDSTNALADARAKLSEMRVTGVDQGLLDTQEGIIANLEKRMRQVVSATGLGPGARGRAREGEKAAQGMAVEDAARQARMDSASPGQAMALREQEIARQKLLNQQTSTYKDEKARVGDEQDKATGAVNLNRRDIHQRQNDIGVSDESDARAQIATLEAKKATRVTGNTTMGMASVGGISDDEEKKLNALKELMPLYGQLSAAQAAYENIARSSTSEIVNGYLKIADAEKAAAEAGLLTNEKAAEFSKARTALDAKRAELEKDQAQRQQHIIELEAQQKQAQVARASSQIDLDAEKDLVAIRSRGMDAAEKEAAIRIGAIQRQLVMATDLDDQQVQTLTNRLAGERKNLDMMRQQAALQREADAAHLQVVSLDQQATLATAQGRFGDAAKLRDERIKVSDKAAYSESYNQKVNSGSSTSDQAKEAADAEQAQRVADRATQRASFLANQGRDLDSKELALSQNPEDRLKAREAGDTAAARGRISDALDNGATPEEAAAFAGRAGSLDLRKQQFDAGKEVVADSLARIGGGGGVSGGDPSLEIQRRQADLLVSIRDLLAESQKPPRTDNPPPVAFGP